MGRLLSGQQSGFAVWLDVSAPAGFAAADAVANRRSLPGVTLRWRIDAEYPWPGGDGHRGKRAVEEG